MNAGEADIALPIYHQHSPASPGFPSTTRDAFSSANATHDIGNTSRRTLGLNTSGNGANSSSKMRITDLTVDVSLTAQSSSNKPLTENEKPLTTSSSPPKSASSGHPAPPPARWRTTEFKIYYIIAIVIVSLMVRVPISLSSPEHPRYWRFSNRLSPGWMFGRDFDNSDFQYRSFRGHLLYLMGAAGLFLSSKFVFKAFLFRNAPPSTAFSNAFQSFIPLIPFNLVFSIVTTIALHGAGSIKVLVLLTLNYLIAKAAGKSKWNVVLTWVFNGGVLFTNEIYGGYRFRSLSPGLAWLDNYNGIYPRWFIIFNITMLRLISFNMDYYWASSQPERVPTPDSSINLSDKQRQEIAHPQETYSYANYLTYVLYPPLYIAGPIMTFNDFMWQHRRPISLPRYTVLRYIVRFLISFMMMEFILHFMYVVAIKDTKAWIGNSAAEICMIGFWNLIVVWLKLLIPWRFFRLWALMDGIVPPENMVRCMANNYSTMGFWRSWHRSYNLWIIRYIYIPLGGSNNLILNTLLVFSFVALWHDLTFRLLAWGWLISLFILPEILGRMLLPVAKYGKRPWYRHVCALGGVLNILMMMVANLVGFVIGMDGIQAFISEVFHTWEGVRFVLFSCGIIFVGVQLMFEYREEEARNGIYRRC